MAAGEGVDRLKAIGGPSLPAVGAGTSGLDRSRHAPIC